MFFDKGDMTEHFADVAPVDMLKFKDTKTYKDRLSQAQKKTEETYQACLAQNLLPCGRAFVVGLRAFVRLARNDMAVRRGAQKSYRLLSEFHG